MKRSTATIKFLPSSIFEGTNAESKKMFAESEGYCFTGYDTVINDILDTLHSTLRKWRQEPEFFKKLGATDNDSSSLMELIEKIANLKEGYIAPEINELIDTLVDCLVLSDQFADWIRATIGGQEGYEGLMDEMVLDHAYYLDKIEWYRKQLTIRQDDLYEITETKQNNEYLDSDFTSNIESFTDYLFDTECAIKEFSLRYYESGSRNYDKCFKSMDIEMVSALELARENLRAILNLIGALEVVGDSINKFDPIYG